MSNTEKQYDGFHLYTGGPFGLRLPGSRSVPFTPIRIWIFAGVMWLPLLISKVLSDPSVIYQVQPWIEDLPHHIRILCSFPFLIYSGFVLDSRISRVLIYLVKGDTASQEQILNAVDQARRKRDSLFLNLFIVFIAVLLSIVRLVEVVNHPKASHFEFLWYSFILQSVMQLAVLIWLTRTLSWTRLLWRLSRIHLKIIPTHPDGKGGLEILNWIQVSYSWVTLGFATLLIGDLFSGGGRIELTLLMHIGKILGVFLFLNLFVFLGPLLFFTAQLCQVKRARLLDYACFADQCSEAFDQKWIHYSQRQSLPKGFPLSQDISAMCDLISVDRQVREMAVVLPDIRTAQRFIIACLIPLIPAVFAWIPPELWMKIIEKVLL
jgi:hypothetical protein